MGNKIPRSWFDEDPEWEFLRRKSEKLPVTKELKKKVAANKPQPRPGRGKPRIESKGGYSTNKEKELVLNLKLAIPKVKLPDLKKFLRAHKDSLVKAASAAAVLVCVFGAVKLISSRLSTGTGGDKPQSPEEQADFTPLVQLENLTDTAGNKSNPELKYYKDKKTINFVTDYNGAKLIISQQALPEALKTNPGQLEGIAMTINPNLTITKLETQKGMAYIGTDEETKLQKAIFATKEVLVLIDANKILDDEEWKFYINQLNPKQ